MSSVADNLQIAIYEKLVAELDVDVFDNVPDRQVGDYVVIGDDTFIDWSTDCTSGFEATLTIHTWTVPPKGQNSFRGSTRCKLIQGDIYDILQRADFEVQDYQNLGADFEYQDVTLDGDGVSYHGVQRFRIFLDTIDTIT